MNTLNNKATGLINLVGLIALSFLLLGCPVLFGGAAVGTVSLVHDRRTAGTVVDDQTLEFNIAKAISGNKYLYDYSHTNVTTFNGVALLTGEASSAEVRQQLIDTVKKVDGLTRLETDVVVGPTSTLSSRGNDSLITSKVKTAILGHVKIDGFDGLLVNVSTERGNVYLMGLVKRNEAKAVVDVARRVNGVKSVTEVFEYIK